MLYFLILVCTDHCHTTSWSSRYSVSWSPHTISWSLPYQCVLITTKTLLDHCHTSGFWSLPYHVPIPSIPMCPDRHTSVFWSSPYYILITAAHTISWSLAYQFVLITTTPYPNHWHTSVSCPPPYQCVPITATPFPDEYHTIVSCSMLYHILITAIPAHPDHHLTGNPTN